MSVADAVIIMRDFEAETVVEGEVGITVTLSSTSDPAEAEKRE